MKRPGDQQREGIQGGRRLVRTPRWNERAGTRSGLAPAGGLDEPRLGGRGNQLVTESGGPPHADETDDR